MRFLFVSKTKGLKLLFLIVCVLNAVVVSGQENLVLETDFEKGTQKWEKRGADTVSIKTTKKEAANGQKSLQIGGRRENWQGAQLNITNLLKPGVTYLFTVSAKLKAGEQPDDIKMTMQRGDNQFEGIAMARVTEGGWTTLSGRFRPSGGDPYMLVYIEATGERTSYYIDDFKIEVLEAPKQSGTLVKSDFQDGTAQNWLVRGENVQMFSAALGDRRFLKVGGRSEPWHGLAFDLSSQLFKGRTYKISVSV
ncbi:MAG: carbohydrate binding domain-containing protein, partial [Acidobacteriota bacterium]|nr:carbohydrate binding domain-containing protein [Acidobacteriota bacterium]